MQEKELYELLELPEEVVRKLNRYFAKRNGELPDRLTEKLFHRTTWDDGIRELQEFLGEDTDGIKTLWEQLHIVLTYTYDRYRTLGISDDIFQATMKFTTRFLNEHFRDTGCYRYVWGWWFPRQMAALEYRIGALEYELVEGDEPQIAVHIPSDADMSREAVQNSLRDFSAFRHRFFPNWENVKLVCDSWMMMPELQELLGEDSNLVAFMRLFDIEAIDREAIWYMDWIYPGYHGTTEGLPEKTTLQKALKNYLLAGKKFGAAKGILRQELTEIPIA